MANSAVQRAGHTHHSGLTCTLSAVALSVVLLAAACTLAGGQCVEFQPSTDLSMLVPLNPSEVWTTSLSMTIEFWAKIESYPSSGDNPPLWSVLDSLDTDLFYCNLVGGSVLAFQCEWQDGVGPPVVSRSIPPDVPADFPAAAMTGWHHFAFVLSSSGGAAYILTYVDGTLHANTYNPADPVRASFISAGSVYYNAVLFAPSGSASVTSLREVRIWNEALGLSTVQANRNKPITSADILGYLSLAHVVPFDTDPTGIGGDVYANDLVDLVTNFMLEDEATIALGFGLSVGSGQFVAGTGGICSLIAPKGPSGGGGGASSPSGSILVLNGGTISVDGGYICVGPCP